MESLRITTITCLGIHKANVFFPSYSGSRGLGRGMKIMSF